MKKILVYCQHLLGIGHVARTMAVVSALAKEFKVDVVMGGPPVKLDYPKEVDLYQIPPLLMTEGKHDLYDPQGSKPVAEIFAQRRMRLEALANNTYDALVVEFYPFGRKKFGPEITGLIEMVRAKNTKAKFVSSIRDILVAKSNQLERDRQMAQEALDLFDLILVHSDPKIIPFSKTFSACELIQQKMRYTGFVANNEPVASVPRKGVLISLGGGSLGQDFMLSAVKILAKAPLPVTVALGPYSRKSLGDEMIQATAGKSDFKVIPFSANFEALLAGAGVSISLGGYNTVMNLLKTKTPALVHPYGGDHEQSLRASVFEQKGYLKTIGEKELPSLLSLVQQVANAPYPSSLPDIDGAEESRRQISFLLNS